MSDAIPSGPNPPMREYGYSPYGYTPTRGICVLFVVLYGITSAVHLAQAVRYRLWWLIPSAVLCGVGEVIGWGGRLWSSFEPNRLDPFLMQITSTIIAPSFLTAALFKIVGDIIILLGPKYSRLKPVTYLIVFITLDVAALVVQAIGGAKASQAAETNNDPKLGGDIMLYGIVVQLIGVTLFVACTAELLVRFVLDKPIRRRWFFGKPADSTIEAEHKVIDSKTTLMLLSVAFITILVYIRSIYRTIELSNGWDGRIIQNETYFNVLDAGAICLAMYTLNCLHPGFLLASQALKVDLESKDSSVAKISKE